MIMAVSRADSSREYECGGCGSALAAVPVFRRLLGEHQVAAIWNADPPAGASVALSCPFCPATMAARSVEKGQAAICHTCQVIWFDREAMGALSTTVPATERLADVGVTKCAYCGAPIASPLDDCCRYCGTTLDFPVSLPA